MSNRCLKFVDTALAVSGKSHLPIYSCKYSKRKYTQHQLLTFILLKEDLNVDCISIVELIELMDKLKSIMISMEQKFQHMQKLFGIKKMERLFTLTFV
jgi:hypothetical protein